MPTSEPIMKLSSLAGAQAMAMTGDSAVTRVLRSHTTPKPSPFQPTAKLADTKITYKARKKKETSEVAKTESNKKREAVNRETEVVEETTTVAVVKKQRKSTSKKTGVVDVVAIGVATRGANGVATDVESWGVSLSTAGALEEATKHLVGNCAKMKLVIETQGAAPVWEQKGSAFQALARAIVYQQLAGKAAATILGRLVGLCGGEEKLTPTVITGLSDEELRTVGISGRKAIYLHDLAEKFGSGVLSDEKLAMMSEDELVTALTAVKGIGVWSAHMFMIFFLHKPDVLPVGDLGIRKGFQKLFQLKQQPSATEMQDLALLWRPYRTLASWYLWRMSDIKLPDA